jgi:prepilin-type N-terminal cleavage/methylation domain-containing protein
MSETDSPRRDSQAGFTIIELMIATAVLSVILLMVTVIMISIGNLYQKGVNQSRVQDNVRTVGDSLTQNLKLMSDPRITTNVLPTGPAPGYVCIDTTRYTYMIGTQLDLTAGQIQHVLWRDTISPGATCTPVNLTSAAPNSAITPGTGGTELVAPGSRLTAFCIGNYDPTAAAFLNPCGQTFTSPFTITVGMAYGDTNLLTNPPYTTNTACKGSTGDQFCATDFLTITVDQRLGSIIGYN